MSSSQQDCGVDRIGIEFLSVSVRHLQAQAHFGKVVITVD